MARLQILELPEGTGDDRPPFVLVIDQYEPPPYPGDANEPVPYDGIAEKIGARAVLVFETTIDIPANDVPVDADGNPLFRAQVEEQIEHALSNVKNAVRGQGDLAHERTDITRDMYRLAKRHNELANALGMEPARNWDELITAAASVRAELTRSENAREHLRQDRDEARSWARHGYEIGQRHCGWSDHGVAPAWLTDGWPNSFDTCEHLKQAAEYDETLSRVRAASAHIRATTRTWEPVANIIDAALNGNQEADDETSTGRPTHPDGTPYNYNEIVAEGWGHCDGCRTWGQWTVDKPHDCPAPAAVNATDA